MKILVCGARGMLGHDLMTRLGAEHEVLGVARVAADGVLAADLADAGTVADLVGSERPEWVVNAAAYTAVDRAESEPAAARRGNEEIPRALASACAGAGARLLHVGTDFVFDGEKGSPYVETDPVRPLGVYAATKEAGERAVREILAEERHLIVRVAWLFGPHGGNFVDTIVRAARTRPELRVVEDQRGTPTFTRDAAEAVAHLIRSDVRGTVHASNRGETSWYEFACEALRLCGLKTPIEPIPTSAWPTPARRPRNSALRNAVLERTLGDLMRPWTEALRDHLRARGELA